MNGKILKKKINVRIEHIRPSTSRKEWIERVRQNELQKKAVKAGEKRECLPLPRGFFWGVVVGGRTRGARLAGWSDRPTHFPTHSSPSKTAFRQLKRLPRQPKGAFTVACAQETIQTIQPIPFVDLV